MSIRKTITIVVILLAVLPFLILTWYSTVSLNSVLVGTYKDKIETSVTYQTETLQNYFDVNATNTKLLSEMSATKEFLMSGSESSKEQLIEYFTYRQTKQPAVRNISIFDKEGKIVLSNNQNIIGEKLNGGKEIINSPGREPTFTSILKIPKMVDVNVFGVISKVYDGDICFGFVIQYIDMSYFEKMGNRKSNFKTEYIYIIDSNGAIAANGGKFDLLTINDIAYKSSFPQTYAEQDIAHKKKGFFDFQTDDTQKLAYYSVIPNSNWVIIDVMNINELNRKSIAYMYQMTLILSIIAIIFFILVKLTIKKVFKPFDIILETIYKIDNGDYLTRIAYNKNDEFGEIATAFNQLMDGMMIQTEQLYESEERHRIVIEQTDDIIWEYNFITDSITYSSLWYKKFGYTPMKFNIFNNINTTSNINPDDARVFKEFISNITSGMQSSQCKIRIRKDNGEYIWVLIRATTIFDDKGMPVKTVGIIIDIDKAKKEEEQLINKAQFDALSGLYNRITFEERAKNHIEICRENNSKLGFMFIDIDDFKDFNTKYGHSFGDRVIKFIGEKLREIIKDIGFAGRIGGDEFVVCITDLVAVDNMNQIAEYIISSLKIGIKIRELDGNLPIHCSIGGVIYPTAGTSYEVIIEKADKAMYDVKQNQKGSYRII